MDVNMLSHKNFWIVNMSIAHLMKIELKICYVGRIHENYKSNLQNFTDVGDLYMKYHRSFFQLFLHLIHLLYISISIYCRILLTILLRYNLVKFHRVDTESLRYSLRASILRIDIYLKVEGILRIRLNRSTKLLLQKGMRFCHCYSVPEFLGYEVARKLASWSSPS